MALARLLLPLLAFAPFASAYSVLSHEAIIDSAWDDSIKPALLARFPDAAPDDLRKAHAYAYGGAIVQDMGYYPFGNHLFSDLVHYFRSGDFIVSEIALAEDLDEYAFALGSLAHYAADDQGHTIATNRAVPLLYPKVRRKFGPTATYEDNPADHLKTEFSFDVAEVAENHFAPASYHDFIGFQVSKPLLERAFLATYGIPLKDIVASLDLALGSYRRSASTIIPEMTRVAWQERKKDLLHDTPTLTKRKFVYAISRAGYEKEWGTTYTHPGPGARILAFIIRFIPKVGPFRALSFHTPTPATQKLFEDSFVKTLALYKEKLAAVRSGAPLILDNINFDTGRPSQSGDYRLADQATEKLLLKLDDQKTSPDDALKHALAQFYGNDLPSDPKAAAELAALR